MHVVAEPPPSPRRRVGAYELVRAIGQGGMAEVWLACRTGLGGADKPCAVKLPLPHIASEPRFRRMFLAEARLAMRLSHGNIVGTFDVGEDGERLFMAMEWVDGVDLAGFAEALRVAGVTLSPSLAAHIVGELLAALDYAHTFAIGGRPQGIVHRDVSPHNVLLSAAGEVRLTDFGIARILHEETSQEHTKGKLRYMPAEHLRGQATQRSDLFAVGAIFHELLDGRKFRDSVSGEAFFGHILDGVVPELQRTDVPPELERLRRALLEPDETRRVATAEAALAMLASWTGYRHQRVALRELVRRHRGRAVRASGLTEHVLVAPPAEPTTPSPAQGSNAVPVWTPAPAPPFFPMPTTTWSDAPTTRTHVPGSRSPAFFCALALALSLPPVFAAIWVVRDHAPVERMHTPAIVAPPILPAPDPAIATPPEPVARPEHAMPTTSAALPESSSPAPTRAQLEPATDTAEPSATPATPRHLPVVRPRRRDALAGPRVEVLVLLEFVDWAEIEIDGRRSVVAPRARLSLTAGRHRVRWRTDRDEPWHDAGMRILEASKTHQLRVRADEVRLRSHRAPSRRNRPHLAVDDEGA